MAEIIAIAGKGGTGKTTVACLVINWLRSQKKGSILAVDADPNSNLAANLGVEQKQSIGEIIDDIAKNPNQVPKGMSKDAYIEYRIQTTLTENGAIDFLAMGRPEGAGCYCYANNALRGIVEKLIKNYDFIVIDNEAGMEHLSRRTTRRADYFLVISDPTEVGLRSAKRIFDLSRELDIKIKNNFLLVNRFNGDREPLKKHIEQLGFGLLGTIGEDKDILELSLSGKPITQLNHSKAQEEIDRIGQRLWP